MNKIEFKNDKSNPNFKLYVYDLFRWTSTGDFVECSADQVQMGGGAGAWLGTNPTKTDALTGEIDPELNINKG